MAVYCYCKILYPRCLRGSWGLSCAGCLTRLVLITTSVKFQLAGHQEPYKKSECQTSKQSHRNREDPILNERFSPTKSLSLIYAALKYLQFILDQNPCSNKIFSFHQDKKVASSKKKPPSIQIHNPDQIKMVYRFLHKDGVWRRLIVIFWAKITYWFWDILWNL